jgi:hypothetical protein
MDTSHKSGDNTHKCDKVGDSGYYGLILAESVVWGRLPWNDQIVSLYDEADKEVYTVILWGDKGRTELKRQSTANDEEAVQIYLSWAFQIEL